MAHPLIKKDAIKFGDKTHWLNENVKHKQALLSRQAGMTKSDINLVVIGPNTESTVRPSLLRSALFVFREVFAVD